MKIAGNREYCANTKCFKLKTSPLNKAERVAENVSILTVKLISNLGNLAVFHRSSYFVFFNIGLGICDLASINSIRRNNLILLNISFANRVLEKKGKDD